MGYKMELANLYTICTFLGQFGPNLVTRFVVENEFFNVKIAIFIAEIIEDPWLLLGHQIYAIPMTENTLWTISQFQSDFGQKTRGILGANGLEISQLQSRAGSVCTPL